MDFLLYFLPIVVKELWPWLTLCAAIIIFAIYRTIKEAMFKKKIGAICKYRLGAYLSGIRGRHKPVAAVEAYFTESSVYFWGVWSDYVGKIENYEIYKVEIEDIVYRNGNFKKIVIELKDSTKMEFRLPGGIFENVAYTVYNALSEIPKKYKSID